MTIHILGAGGHAKVVIDALLQQDVADIKVYSSDAREVGMDCLGFTVEAETNISKQAGLEVHIAIGSQTVRAALSEACIRAGQKLITIIYPGQILANKASIAAGSFIAKSAILGPEAKIGQSCIINHGAIVDHEVIVDDYSHIAPNVTLGGKVRIGKGCLIGAGAIILPDTHIGDNVIVGAGAVVTKNIEADTTVVGCPAKPVHRASHQVTDL